MRAVLALTVAALVASTALGFYDGKSAVTNLTPDNFEDKVVKSSGVWLVEFYAPWCGHCKNLAPEWSKAAKALKGAVHIAAVDADKYRDLGAKFDVSGFPTIKVFGADKSKPTDYDGGRTAAAIVDAALAEAKKLTNGRLGIKDEPPKQEKKQQQQQAGGFYEGTDVVELTDETFESDVLNPEGKGGWLVEFYAPWCGHCKNLAPEWKKAATAMAGSLKIAAVDATAHRKYSEQYKVQGFPTIKFFPPGGKEPEDYNGGRSADAIIAYSNEKAALYPAAAPEVNQVASSDALDALCKGKSLCVVFVVPHVFDTKAEGRNKLIESFVNVATKLRSRGVAFGWIVGGEHVAFEEAFGVFSTYPTFVALNTESMRATHHRGTFGEAALVASVKKILDGKGGLSKLGAIPKLSKNVPLWDGKDYTPAEDDEL